MNKMARQVIFTSAAVALVSLSSVFADSSTPPTREGFTPGSGPASRCGFDATATCVTQSAAPVDTHIRTHHRLNQGVD